MKNVVIDTDRPFYSEGKIENCGKDFFDLRIDAEKFPYRVENGSIIFFSDTWQQNLNEGINLFLEYDSVLKRPAYFVARTCIAELKQSASSRKRR